MGNFDLNEYLIAVCVLLGRWIGLMAKVWVGTPESIHHSFIYFSEGWQVISAARSQVENELELSLLLLLPLSKHRSPTASI